MSWQIGVDVVPAGQESRYYDRRPPRVGHAGEDFARGGTQHIHESYLHLLAQQRAGSVGKFGNHGGARWLAGSVRRQNQVHAAPERSSTANR